MKIRINNDVKLTWKIYKNAEPYFLLDKTLAVVLLDPTKRKVPIEYNFMENRINVVYRGKDQYEVGNYTIMLIENRDSINMTTVDYLKCFELVRHTEQADNCNVPEGMIIDVPAFSSYITSSGGSSDPVDAYTKEQMDAILADYAKAELVSDELNKKANTAHMHELSDINNLTTKLAEKADKQYVQGEIANKANTVHQHEINDVSNLQSQLDNKATTSALESGLSAKLDATYANANYATKTEVKEQIATATGKEWFGTRQEYDALGAHNADVKYYIYENA